MSIVLWELLVRVLKARYEQPFTEEFPHLSLDFQIPIQVAEKGLRPSIPSSCPSALSSIVQQCWQGVPESRPTAAAILDILLQQYEEITGQRYPEEGMFEKKFVH